MHIKHMHEMIEKLTECTKEAIENDQTNVGQYPIHEVVDMIKDLNEASYYASIVKAMEETGEEPGMPEEARKYYRGRRRDSRGRFMYTEPPYMHMQEDMERDMDYGMGRMYYTEGHMDGMHASRHGSSYDAMMEARKNYSASDPKGKMERDRMSKQWHEDLMLSIDNALEHSTPEEKAQLKQALMKEAGKIQ